MTSSWATAARDVPGLDHDPCPGDVPAVHRLAADLRGRSDDVAAAAGACRGWQPTGWRGDASVAARGAVADLADGLDPLRRSYEQAADVLGRWADDLAELQAEAAALGAQTQELRRSQLLRTLAAGPPGTPSDVVGEQQRLADERRVLQSRVDLLHARWLAASRRRSAELDEAAPAAAGPWRGAWDQAHDSYQDASRRSARTTGWVAEGAGGASVVVAAVALAAPATAPATVPASVGLAVLSSQAQVSLAVGADGSVRDAVLSVATTAAGAALGAVAAGARTGPVLREVADGVGTASDVASAASAVATALDPRGDGEAPGAVVGLDGGTVDVTVHDVASPWHVGHGLQGAGFVGVAVVPVTGAAARPAARPASRSRPSTGPRPAVHVGAGEPDRAGARSG